MTWDSCSFASHRAPWQLGVDLPAKALLPAKSQRLHWDCQSSRHQPQLGADDVLNSPKMLFQRVIRSSISHSKVATPRCLPMIQRRTFMPAGMYDKKVIEAKYPSRPTLTDAEDPDMNGGYVNPPRIKRQFRDPYADWWDPQERRNYGEPIHEDNDTLGMFSPWEYTWTTPRQAFLLLGVFFSSIVGIYGAASLFYPDRPSYPREFEGGLERELGGPGAVRVWIASEKA
ncbi:hypothetical protein E4U44_003187 [Claviceps purpurea]|nr:hypothetical protein E4U44_003187 [Claviceps purpurea]